MIIKKYLHSCLLLEEDGKRLLIDPGMFSFIEGKLTPEDIGPVDVILFTHKHPDHYDPEALKAIIGSSRLRSNNTILRPSEARGEVPIIVTHTEIGALLEKEGLPFEAIAAGETKTIAGFTIQALAAAHGPIPAEPPHNLAYLINGKVLHPGDSLDVDVRGLASRVIEAKPRSTSTLALPIAGPWLRLVDALEFAKRLAPSHVIPIHDAIIKEFMLQRMNVMIASNLEAAGIAFHPIGLGESLDV